tara:strand:- start:1587 stop:1898 length:312 start_codon:yes stop_codon:yes gene_type:complete
MKKITSIFIFLILFSCSSLKDAGKVIRNEKITTTDEFLVKKKDPLILPPNYEKIPQPDTLKENKSKEKDVKSILKINTKNQSLKKNSSTEKSIIEKIKMSGKE